MTTGRPTAAPAPTPTDSVLLAGLARHDETALVSLIESSGRYIYGKALQILHEPALAEEVAQDTLLALWWRPERFDPSKGSIRSFLMGIARFKAIDLVRREEVIRSKAARLLDAKAFFEPSSVDDEFEGASAVRAAIRLLPAMKREVIYLAFYQGLTYREVAKQLGLPEGTVKTRIRDSLIRLKTEISLPDIA